MNAPKQLHATRKRGLTLAGMLLVTITQCQAGGRGAWKMDDFQYPSWNYDRFHIMAWGGPWVPSSDDPCEAVIIDYVAAGFNAIRGNMDVSTIYITPAVQYRLAEKYDLALIDYDAWTYQVMTPLGYPGSYRAITNQWWSKAKCGYFIFDEPHPGVGTHPANLFQVIDFNINSPAGSYATDDPNKLIYINVEGVNGSSTAWYDNYINLVGPDFLSFSHYPNGGSNYTLMYDFMENALRATTAHGLELWTFVQACEPELKADGVTPHDETDLVTTRWEAWGGVAYGSRCIQYFGYVGPPENWKGGYIDPVTGEPTNRYYYGKEVNNEIQALGPHLVKLICTGVEHLGTLPIGTTAFVPDSVITGATSGNFFISRFSHEDNASYYYFMVGDRTFQGDPDVVNSVTLTFDASATEVYEISRVDGSHILQTLTSNQLAINLKAGKAKLFCVGDCPVEVYTTPALVGGATEEPRTLADVSGLGHDGAITGGGVNLDSLYGQGGLASNPGSHEVEWIRDGRFGQCIRFTRNTTAAWVAIPGDDEDYWDCAADDPFTIQLWFKCAAQSTAWTEHYLFMHSGNDNVAQRSIALDNDGHIRAKLQSDNPAGLMQAQSTGTYDNSQWHHVAIVKAGQGQFTLYVDGESEAVTSNDVGTDDTGFTQFDLVADSMRLGRHCLAVSNFIGYIDEFAILDQALAPAELGYYGELDVDPDQCGDLGTTYLAADLNRDCQVGLADLAQMAGQWLGCSDPSVPECTY